MCQMIKHEQNRLLDSQQGSRLGRERTLEGRNSGAGRAVMLSGSPGIILGALFIQAHMPDPEHMERRSRNILRWTLSNLRPSGLASMMASTAFPETGYPQSSEAAWFWQSCRQQVGASIYAKEKPRCPLRGIHAVSCTAAV